MEQVQNTYTKTNQVNSDPYNIFGDQMTFYYVKPFSDATFDNYSASHLWSLLGFYNETSYNLANKPYSEGGMLDTAFRQLPEAFNSKGMIVGVFDNTTYRTQLDGYNFGIKIPLDHTYSGSTSGSTSATLYSSFIWDPNCLTISPNNLCSGTIQDSKIDETSEIYTNNFGIGFPYTQGVNPKTPTDQYHSGIVYLVSDSVEFTLTGSTGSSVSWSYLFSSENKYALGARTIMPSLGQTNISGWYDRIVGLLNLHSGMVMIWDNDLVSAFSWSGFTGDKLTGSTTTSGTTYAVTQDFDNEVVLAIDIIVPPNKWKNTTNPSIIGETNCDTAFTSICLYDDLGNLIGVAKPNEAIVLPENGYTPFTLEVPISGSINEDTGDWTDGVTLAL